MSKVQVLRQRLVQRIRCPLPGDTWILGHAELELQVGPHGRVLAATLRVFPARMEILVKLPKVVVNYRYPADPFTIARLAAEHPLVLSFEATPEILAKLPPRVPDTDALLKAVAAMPSFLDLTRYTLAGISVLEEGPAAASGA